MIDQRAAKLRGWTIVEVKYPVLDVVFNHATAKPLRLRLNCTDWGELPPAIDLLEADGAYLATVPNNTNSVFNQGPHERTHRPFICMRGSREYHTHSGHVSDRWDNYRGQSGMDLGGIVFQLWRVWKGSVG
jgi:hypothetical protein